MSQQSGQAGPGRRETSAGDLEPGQRRRAWLRFALGNAQMFTAVVALILIVRDGVTATALAATIVACGMTLLSRVLFRRDPKRWPVSQTSRQASPDHGPTSDIPPTTRSIRP